MFHGERLKGLCNPGVTKKMNKVKIVVFTVERMVVEESGPAGTEVEM